MKQIYFLVLFLVFACNKNEPKTLDGYEAVEIKAGKHISSNGERGIGTNQPVFSWRFQPSAEYLLYPDSVLTWQQDQRDWNKLIGLSYNLVSNHVNTAMVGWRWNSLNDVFELNAYFHIDENRIYTAPIAHVETEQNFKTWVHRIEDSEKGFSQVEIIIVTEADPIKGFDSVSASYTAEFKTKNLPEITRKIATWFGGNQTAPNDILIYRKKLEIW